jgi:cytidylate kinase
VAGESQLRSQINQGEQRTNVNEQYPCSPRQPNGVLFNQEGRKMSIKRKYSVDAFRRYLSAQSLPAAGQPRIPKPAITISRQSWAGAVTVGNLVAQQLDLDCQGSPPCPWAVFDRELVAQIVEDHHLAKEVEQFMPEDSKFPLTDALEALLGLHPSSWTLKEHANETIRKLAAKGNVILIGRGAAVITALFPRVLHFRLIAPFHLRVQNCAEFHHITAEKASRLVRETDEARRRYVQDYFGADVDDPLYYHLVINTGRASVQEVAQIISNALVSRVSIGDRKQTGSLISNGSV